jgi:hypothetical protein
MGWPQQVPPRHRLRRKKLEPNHFLDEFTGAGITHKIFGHLSIPATMEYDFTKRGYLLPAGCKDLIDALKLKPRYGLKPSRPKQPASLPPVIGELVVPEPASVADLAGLLDQKPFVIVADLMGFGVLATVHQVIDFETISRVTRKYGFTARRAA